MLPNGAFERGAALRCACAGRLRCARAQLPSLMLRAAVRSLQTAKVDFSAASTLASMVSVALSSMLKAHADVPRFLKLFKERALEGSASGSGWFKLGSHAARFSRAVPIIDCLCVAKRVRRRGCAPCRRVLTHARTAAGMAWCSLSERAGSWRPESGG